MSRIIGLCLVVGLSGWGISCGDDEQDPPGEANNDNNAPNNDPGFEGDRKITMDDMARYQGDTRSDNDERLFNFWQTAVIKAAFDDEREVWDIDSPHFLDQLALWLNNERKLNPFHPEDVKASVESHRVFQP